MAYTTINKSADYFNPKLYTGTGSSNAITGVGFQPDLVWIKNRSQADWHQLFNAVSGAGYVLYPNETAAESSASSSFTSFDSDGFTVNTNDGTNGNGESLVAWNWKANGSGSANTAGSINSTVSVNATSGFSISSYTGTGSLATVGHGLGVAPAMIIIKNRSTTNGWEVFHQSLGNTRYMQLHSTSVGGTSATRWNNTSPTSNVFTVNTENGVNSSSGNLIAYCFAEKQGYSKFGSYTGNGNADGTFVYTGFKPAYVMIKNTSATQSWLIYDNKISPFNVITALNFANSSSAEDPSAGARMDIVSNGFKLRVNHAGENGSGSSYIYMAFAEAPLVGTNNVPCTAR